MPERVLCICGCGKRADILHHVIYRQELMRVVGGQHHPHGADTDYSRYVTDPRGMVPMAQSCHERHHSRSRALPLSVLPDEAFVFAVEVLGAGRAYNYLGRVCVGEDPRLDALLALDNCRDVRTLEA